MSKGSPVIPMRINELDLTRIDKAIKQANRTRKLTPYNRSSWIMAAIQDRLAHTNRGAKARARKAGRATWTEL